LTSPRAIEAAVLEMADEVWAWCEKTGTFGRTVTVKIKFADFRQITRSRTVTAPVRSREMLHSISTDLVRAVLPPPTGIRLVGVTLSGIGSGASPEPQQMGFDL
jgi:DNA polymerase-4